jgi:hypothetical protein
LIYIVLDFPNLFPGKKMQNKNERKNPGNKEISKSGDECTQFRPTMPFSPTRFSRG